MECVCTFAENAVNVALGVPALLRLKTQRVIRLLIRLVVAREDSRPVDGLLHVPAVAMGRRGGDNYPAQQHSPI